MTELTGTLSVHRLLHDGASYDLTAAEPGVTVLAVVDADGDLAMPEIDRSQARQLIDDLTLVAGLTPTASAIGKAAAIAGAVRRNFELLAELERADPAAADAIYASIAAHLRSWKPMTMLAVTP